MTKYLKDIFRLRVFTILKMGLYPFGVSLDKSFSMQLQVKGVNDLDSEVWISRERKCK